MASLSTTTPQTPRTPQFKSTVTNTHSYTLTVSTTNSCTAILPYNVIVDENPVFTLGPDIAACSGVSTKITVNPTGGSKTYTYDWTDDNGAFNLPHDNAPTYVKTQPGNYNIYLKVIDDVTNCSSTDAMVITINQNPVVNPTGLGCAGSIISVLGNPSLGSGSYTKHEWSLPDAALLLPNQTTANPTLQTATPGPRYLHYKVTDSKGCIGEKDVTVMVNDLPKPVISGKPLLQVCANTTLPLTVSNAGTSYQWTGTGVKYLDNPKAQNPKFTSTVAGTYSLTVTAADGNSCSATDVITVQVNPLPTPVMKNDSICAGDSKRLQGDDSFSQYLWSGDISILSPSDVTSSSPQIITTSATIAKTYNLQYMVKDALGCSATIPVTIKVNALPIANAGDDKGFADGDAVSLTALPNVSQCSYAWSPSASLQNSLIQNPTTIPLHSSITFVLTVTDNVTQCDNIASIKLTDTTGLLTVKIAATPAEICIGDTSNIDVLPTGGKAPYIYTWSTAVDKQYANGSVRIKPTITTVYSLSVQDQNGAIATASATVTVNQLPSVSVVDQKVCTNDTLHISPTVVPQNATTISSYLWTGAGSSGLHGSTSTENVSFYNNQPGIYPLTLTVKDSKTCVNSASMFVTIDVLPVITMQASKTEICAGSSVTLSVAKSTAASIATYTWSEEPTGHLSSLSGISNTYSSTVSGDVTVTVVDANGCKASTNHHIIVNQNPIALIANATVCQNDVLVLDGKPSGGSGTYTTHAWTGAVVDIANVSPLDSQTPSFSTSVSGTYTVNYAVTDSKTCTGGATIQVVVNALPSTSYSPQPLEVCAGSSLFITASTKPYKSLFSYKWIENNQDGYCQE
jgi:hypothetical protein